MLFTIPTIHTNPTYNYLGMCNSTIPLEIEINPGDKICFIGANGSGKSRLGQYLFDFYHQYKFENFKQKLTGIDNQLVNIEDNLNNINNFIENTRSIIDLYKDISEKDLTEIIKSYRDKYIISNISREMLLNMFLKGGINGHLIKKSDQKIIDEDRRRFVKIEGGEVYIKHILIGLIDNLSIDISTQSLETIKNKPKNLNEIKGDEIVIMIKYRGIYYNISIDLYEIRNFTEINKIRAYRLQKEEKILQYAISDKKLIQNDKNNKKREREIVMRQIEDGKRQGVSFSTGFWYCCKISAHRSLVSNKNSDIKSYEQASNQNLFGTNRGDGNAMKSSATPIGQLEDNFDKLIDVLKAEEANIGARYRQSRYIANKTNKHDKKLLFKETPETTLDQLKSIWKEFNLSSEIYIDTLSLKAMRRRYIYDLTSMSEGEKSLFYILGKCLTAKHKSIIIIDEPDIHINRSILKQVFNKIEEVRKDCSFIYMTHDLDFAQSRKGNKYAVIDYKYNEWSIEQIKKKDEIPENIYNIIYGARHPILFTEGGKNSLDKIYNDIYPNLKVIPTDNCDAVISYTKYLNKHKSIHRNQYFGIIDKDGRTDDEICELRENNIYVIDYAIIENIFLLPQIVEILYEINSTPFNKKEYIESFLENIKNEGSEEWKKKEIQKIAEKEFQKQQKDIKYNSDHVIEIKLKPIKEKLESELQDIYNKGSKLEQLGEILKKYRCKSIFNKFLPKKLAINKSKDVIDKILYRIDNLKIELQKILPKINNEN